MKTLINKLLGDIEKEKKIKILFAVESGSRAWGLESENSDYDVRYVYYRNTEEYLKIDKPEEVISTHYDREGNKAPQEGCFIDCVGFDIFKFTKMLSASNPTVIEWLMSNIIYRGEQNKVFKEYATNNFNPVSLYYHYSSMCRQNYLKYLKSGNLVTYKKYLYAMRGLVNALYVLNFKKVPNINFKSTLALCMDSKLIPVRICLNTMKIIKLKKAVKEKDIIQNEVVIDSYIESFLKQKPEFTVSKPLIKKDLLNKEILKIIMKE